jgi:hypothetical protein
MEMRIGCPRDKLGEQRLDDNGEATNTICHVHRSVVSAHFRFWPLSDLPHAAQHVCLLGKS